MTGVRYNFQILSVFILLTINIREVVNVKEASQQNSRQTLYEVQECFCNKDLSLKSKYEVIWSQSNHVWKGFLDDYDLEAYLLNEMELAMKRFFFANIHEIYKFLSLFHQQTLLIIQDAQDIKEFNKNKGDIKTVKVEVFINVKQIIKNIKLNDFKVIVVLLSSFLQPLLLEEAVLNGFVDDTYVWIMTDYLIPNKAAISNQDGKPALPRLTLFLEPYQLKQYVNFDAFINEKWLNELFLSLINKTCHANKLNESIRSNDCSSVVQTEFIDQNTVYQISYLQSSRPLWKPIGINNQNIDKIKFNSFALNLFSKFPFYQEKNSLRVTTIVDPPFVISTPGNLTLGGQCFVGKLCKNIETINGTRITVLNCCIGLCIDLIQRLEEDSNIILNLHLVEDNFYGTMINGKWNGLIGELVNDIADVTVAAITVTNLRATVVDFSDPFIAGGMALAVRADISPLSYFNLGAVKPLSSLMWISLLFLTLVISFAVLLTETKVGNCKNRTVYSYSESFLYFGGLLFQRDMGARNPINLSSRVISIGIALFMLIAMSTYTAVLTANIVTQETTLPVKGFHDRKITIPTKKFKYGVEDNTAMEDTFRRSTNPIYTRIYHFMEDNGYNFNGTKEGVNKLKSGDLDGIISDIYVLHYYMTSEFCKIQIAGDPIETIGYGIGVRKGLGNLKDMFSLLIRRYKKEKYIERLRAKWFSNACSKEKKQEAVINVIGIRYFGGLFIVLLGIIVLSIFFLICESLVFWRHKNRNSYQPNSAL